MKNNFLIFLIIIGCMAFIKAQNISVQSRERDIRNHPDFIRYLEHGKKTSLQPVHVQKSNYFGLEHTLSKFFFYEQIPSDFPIAKENITREEYIKEINNWLLNNRQRIKPDKQNKQININGEEYEKN